MNKFLYLLKEKKSEYVFSIIVTSLLSGIEGLIHPLLLKLIFDEGVIKGDFHKFVFLTLIYLLIGILLNISGLFNLLWFKSLENRIIISTSSRMLEAFYEKNYASVLKNGEGYFISRIYNDIKEGLIPLLILIKEMISEAVRLVAFIGILFYLSWQATIILLMVIPVSVYISALLGKKIRKTTAKEREQQGIFLNILNRAISGFKIIKIFGLINKTLKGYEEKLHEYLMIGYKNYKTITIYQTSNYLAMNISDFLSMFVGALFVLKGQMTFGGYLAFVNTFWRTVTTLMQISQRTPELHKNFEIVKRTYEFEKTKADQYFIIDKFINLKNVYFSYDSMATLENFSLEINMGERVLILGSNGSGKTTLANIVSGHLSPQRGTLILPEKISSVTLPLSLPYLKIKELVNDRNLLAKFRLNHMMDMSVDELSVGQKQKLAVAMALLKNSDLYVFDEPLVSIDNESTEVVMSEILYRTKGKILIVIMHDRDKYQNCFDRIIDLDEYKKLLINSTIISNHNEKYHER